MNLRSVESIIRIVGYIATALIAIFNLSSEVSYFKQLRKR